VKLADIVTREQLLDRRLAQQPAMLEPDYSPSAVRRQAATG
jgi:hypothetical protein